MEPDRRIRVLVVDDSAVARDLLERGLSRDPTIEVVGKAQDVFVARDKIVYLKPDVLTLDIEMPRMDGIEFLKRLLPQYPIPVVVVSAVTPEGSRRAMEALAAGAVAVVAKPGADNAAGLAEMIAELAEAVKGAARADVAKLKRQEAMEKKVRAAISLRSEGRIIAIGASTGGTTALNRVIPEFPTTMPGTVIVQHMPPVFTRLFAEALDKVSKVDVKEAEDGDKIRPGLVLIAPGDIHVRLLRDGAEWKVSCAEGPKVSGHRPSVDVLFSSVARSAGSKAIGLLMTGMGRDGAAGLLEMRMAGARCFAQDEESSVVFGMPKEAWDAGAAERLIGLDEVVDEFLACLEGRPDGGGR
jgi:two-component system, chemotaxis family, protein-glutamate methylesterase/glutaminase